MLPHPSLLYPPPPPHSQLLSTTTPLSSPHPMAQSPLYSSDRSSKERLLFCRWSVCLSVVRARYLCVYVCLSREFSVCVCVCVCTRARECECDLLHVVLQKFVVLVKGRFGGLRSIFTRFKTSVQLAEDYQRSLG